MNKKFLAAWGILILGIIFLIAGISRGELHVMLIKSINICLECIGIG